MKIQLGHSPDADDAFMFYALAYHKIQTNGFEFEHILRDIETLNQWAREKKLEVTALSVHAYAYVARDYALLPFGASIGDQYGPVVVANRAMNTEELKQAKIAIPGELTTAFLALSLCLGGFSYEVVPFDQIFSAVKDGRVDAGLIIHEGQLTYSNLGFQKILDLGEWWHAKTDLPLPLGVNGIRKDLGNETCKKISSYLQESIEYGLSHREDALAYAMKYARNAEKPLTDRFVGMYVNDYTRNLGERGRLSIDRLLKEGHAAGFIPAVELEII
jgi:1,4-dihydroxy-6-naphthoate synthase